MNYYLLAFKKYANFNGRSTRSEYWYFIIFNIIIIFVLRIIGIFINSGANVLGFLYSLFIIIPTLSVSVRRLHDIGKSGWMILISLVPFIGSIWFIILMIKDSQKGENKYGSNPKEILISKS